MSSHPSSPEKTGRRPFEPWRKVMLVGAFVLLGGAIANALMDGGLPRWATFVTTFLGYGFLAVGFSMRMRGLKEARERKAAEARGESPTSAQ